MQAKPTPEEGEVLLLDDRRTEEDLRRIKARALFGGIPYRVPREAVDLSWLFQAGDKPPPPFFFAVIDGGRR